jgi:hypothetical protein
LLTELEKQWILCSNFWSVARAACFVSLQNILLRSPCRRLHRLRSGMLLHGSSHRRKNARKNRRALKVIREKKQSGLHLACMKNTIKPTFKMTLAERFCHSLIDAMPTPQARMICVMELGRWAGKCIYLPAEKRAERRKKAARNMLDEGSMSPADIALAIHERFSVSLRTAQRDVRDVKVLLIK